MISDVLICPPMLDLLHLTPDSPDYDIFANASKSECSQHAKRRSKLAYGKC
jgi:hypothetical protein